MNGRNDPLAQAFCSQAVTHLRDEFMPKIRTCLELLTEEEVWWRASEMENSVGNLLLHLSGNVRQWIVSGLGGAPDRRDRPSEFAARGSVSREEALSRLEAAVEEAAAVLNRLSAGQLLERRVIQGFDRTGLEAVFHVVEHFSYHTGQIVFVTKMVKKRDLKFYNL